MKKKYLYLILFSLLAIILIRTGMKILLFSSTSTIIDPSLTVLDFNNFLIIDILGSILLMIIIIIAIVLIKNYKKKLTQ